MVLVFCGQNQIEKRNAYLSDLNDNQLFVFDDILSTRYKFDWKKAKEIED